MCGIVGYIGQKTAKSVLLNGLERLEYRGYDSAGIALHNGTNVTIYKDKGRIAHLRSLTESVEETTFGIGHTRWATHGKPEKRNAHPHGSASQRFTIVHNGVIENYLELKKTYLSDVTLQSDTDTEILVQVIEKKVAQGMSTEEAIVSLLSETKGAYAIAVIDGEDNDTMYAAKNKSPLLVGRGEDFNAVVSDAMAIIDLTKTFIEIHDGEIVIVHRDRVEMKTLDGTPVIREPYTASLDMSDIEKGTYDAYMHKEIEEQPIVMRKLIEEYTDENKNIAFDPEILEAVRTTDRIYIIGNGTSYNAGLVGKVYFERIAKIPTEVHIASEFSYNMPLIDGKNPLFIHLTQSGETADSRAVLVQTNKLGYRALTITNVPGSTLSREANYTLLLHAGPEIAVASTKAYTAQIAMMALLAKAIKPEHELDVVSELSKVASIMESLIGQKEELKVIANKYLGNDVRSGFYIGRTLDALVCFEAALKLKEISYIQTEGFSSGELKHGTIALIEDNIPVVALISQKNVALHTRGNIQEVLARGANVCVISTKSVSTPDDHIIIEDIHELLAPLVMVVPTQYISYYVALSRGLDIDKPRNLAKSVTVE